MKLNITTALLAFAMTFTMTNHLFAQEDGKAANEQAEPAPASESSVGIPLPPELGQLKPGESDPLFDADISYFTKSQGVMTIKVRSEAVVVNESGDRETKVFYDQQTVDTTSELSPEQRLGVFNALTEKQINQNLAALSSANDDETKKEIIALLKDQYEARYRYDTAYQDYMARKAEANAKKLRGEVDARTKAGSKWVDAMIALAQTKADGIEVMNDAVTVIATKAVDQVASQE